MLVSYKWLQEYVDVPWAPEALAERLTMSGLEVEGLEPLAADLSEVYVGFVRAAKQHPPNADNLTVCSVEVGERGQLYYCLRRAECGSGGKRCPWPYQVLGCPVAWKFLP